jgi:hypothetical protein
MYVRATSWNDVNHVFCEMAKVLAEAPTGVFAPRERERVCFRIDQIVLVEDDILIIIQKYYGLKVLSEVP